MLSDDEANAMSEPSGMVSEDRQWAGRCKTESPRPNARDEVEGPERCP